MSSTQERVSKRVGEYVYLQTTQWDDGEVHTDPSNIAYAHPNTTLGTLLYFTGPCILLRIRSRPRIRYEVGLRL